MMKTFYVTVRHWRYIQWISCFILWLTVETWNQFNSIFGCLLACVWRCHARKKNDRWTQQNQSHFYNENFSWKMETKNDNTTTVYRKCNHIYLYALIKCTKVIWTQKSQNTLCTLAVICYTVCITNNTVCSMGKSKLITNRLDFLIFDSFFLLCCRCFWGFMLKPGSLFRLSVGQTLILVLQTLYSVVQYWMLVPGADIYIRTVIFERQSNQKQIFNIKWNAWYGSMVKVLTHESLCSR